MSAPTPSPVDVSAVAPFCSGSSSPSTSACPNKSCSSSSSSVNVPSAFFSPADGSSTEKQGFGTLAIHVGSKPDPVTGAVVTPISLATTFAQKAPGQPALPGMDYSRSANPTRAAFEECIASLEHAKYGLAFASGSAATVTITHLLKSGDHVVSVDDVYGGTNRFFNRVAAPSYGMQFSMVDLSKGVEALEAAIQPNTKMVWLETPTNPTLKVIDIVSIAAAAHKKGLIVVVDNTFASPFLQTPLDLGADIVVHSVTKYIGGHSDVVMGVLATNNDELHTKLKFLQNSIGAVPAPFDCYMALRGVKTLHLRMREHCKNAMAVATMLEKHEKVERVIYPGLASHPNHEIAKKQMRGFGGMVTFFIKGGLEESRKFLGALKLFTLAESLGAVESLAEHPAIMTHASVPADQRAKLGIADNLIRLSIGCEELEDMVKDLDNALKA